MLTIDALKKYGANVEEGLTRCINNEALYLRLVGTVVDEKNFDKLRNALEEGNPDEAFEAAHALKGVLGNLALTPIYDKVVEMTELLRARTDMDYSALETEIENKREELRSLM
ncbi:MAG: Hpt domain-containing protein [Lachnospiraceae bacterium]|nr:Hpt domain-containing protein [Lachnospiraceae bacterium]